MFRSRSYIMVVINGDSSLFKTDVYWIKAICSRAGRRELLTALKRHKKLLEVRGSGKH